MSVCALAADTKVETPEGAMTIRSVAGKSIAVFTREPEGRVRFRMMQNVRKTAEQQPVLKLTLETGHSFRVAAEQVLYKKGMVECRADALRVGDGLEPAFHYPQSYRFKDDVGGSERESDARLRITRVEAGGNADIYTFAVQRTGCFFLSAGVLCKAEPASGSAAASASS
jgi:hypothetical protein